LPIRSICAQRVDLGAEIELLLSGFWRPADSTGVRHRTSE
jgi:hypothetical protein